MVNTNQEVVILKEYHPPSVTIICIETKGGTIPFVNEATYIGSGAPPPHGTAS